MKKSLISFTFPLFIAVLSLFSTSCKKSVGTPAPVNTAVIKLNGALPSVDSVKVSVHNNNSSITAIYVTAYLNHSPSSLCEIQLYFSPSDPLYATGAVIDFSSTHNAGLVYQGTSVYYDDSMHPSHSGTITITKNDVAARRIEGILTDCIATTMVNGANSPSVKIEGSFAVTYPAQ